MAEARNVHIHLESDGEAWQHVHVQRLTGREAISRPFSFELRVVCEAGHLLPESALPGAAVTAVIEIDGVPVRRIRGILGPICDYLDPVDERPAYDLCIVPRFHRLSLVQTQEIYLGLSVPDIVRRKLELNGLEPKEIAFRLLDAYPARDFVVQYRETDLAFASRLLEHAGISYFFDPREDEDRIIVTDNASGFGAPAEGFTLPFAPRGERRDVFELEVRSDLVPTSYIVQDYNYRAPMVDLSAAFDLEEGNGGGVVEYGAHVKTPEEAERTARIRGEERRCRHVVYRGQAARPDLFAGLRASLVDHPRFDGSKELLFTEVEHEIHVPVFDEDASKASLVTRFSAVRGEVPFRPARVTPRPRMTGMLTGVIQPGPDGETGGTAEMDSEGRYWVVFHFDTTQPGEKKASHPVRMAQPFAGPDYGMNFPLRRGTEVLISFTDGDPDRPVIVGALYNATSPSPVNASNAGRHQLKSATGSLIEISSKS